MVTSIIVENLWQELSRLASLEQEDDKLLGV